MEMCYDGALVMPSSYAVMDENEMMYLEGGVKVSTWIASAAIDIAVTAVLGGCAASALGWLMGKGINKLTSLLIRRGGKVASYARNILGNGGAAKIQSKLGIAGFVLGFTSVGGFIANMWDVKDGKINGYVNIG